MKKIWLCLSSLLCMLLAFTGCDPQTAEALNSVIEQQLESEYQDESYYEEDLTEEEAQSEEAGQNDTKEQEDALEDVSENGEEVVSENTVEEAALEGDIENDADGAEVADGPSEEEVAIDKDGHYTSRDEVALYLYTYGELPDNFITKKEAQALGWDSRKGNLHDVAPGMSIGGDRFGNYEQMLPDNDYKECDINYSGGYRGDERIVFSDDGDIYYTDDHYASFIQLY